MLINMCYLRNFKIQIRINPNFSQSYKNINLVLSSIQMEDNTNDVNDINRQSQVSNNEGYHSNPVHGSQMSRISGQEQQLQINESIQNQNLSKRVGSSGGLGEKQSAGDGDEPEPMDPGAGDPDEHSPRQAIPQPSSPTPHQASGPLRLRSVEESKQRDQKPRYSDLQPKPAKSPERGASQTREGEGQVHSVSLKQNRSSSIQNKRNQPVFQSLKQISLNKKVGVLGSHSNINAIIPSSSVPQLSEMQSGADLNINSMKRQGAEKAKKPARKSKVQIMAQNYREDLWKIQEQIANRRQLLLDEANYSRQTNAKLNSNDGLKRCMQTACCCFSKCFPVFNYVKRYQFNLKIETITCNKLSHCLFDFDCPDFSQYENEKYDHQVFKFHSLFSNRNEPKMLSLLDLSFHRDLMQMQYDSNKVEKGTYLNPARFGNKILLPYPDQDPARKAKFLFRVVFKPETGQLWGFNEFTVDNDLIAESDFHEVFQENPRKKDGQSQSGANETEEDQVADTKQSKAGRESSVPALQANQSFVSGGFPVTSSLQQRSELMHSRQNLVDDQITINYDLSHPTHEIKTEVVIDEKGGKQKKKKKKMSKMERFAHDNNFHILPQEQLDKEIEFENDVDLAKTMWHVIRNKKSCNNILKRFETREQLHYLKVNDIVKFGRVNFKVSIIKSDRLAQELQGGYHLLQKKNQEIQEQLERLQNLQTQQCSYRDVPPKKEKMTVKQFDSTFGRGDLDEDLRQAPRQAQNNPSPQDQTNNDMAADVTRAEAHPYAVQESAALHRDATAQDLHRRPTEMPNQTNVTNTLNGTMLGEEGPSMEQASRNAQATVAALQENTGDAGGQAEGERADVNFNRRGSHGDQMGADDLYDAKKIKGKKGSDDLEQRSSILSSAGAMAREETVCRICLGTEEEGTPSEDGQPDKLICPCKCAGSMGMIHISCLKEWVNSKRLVYKGKKVQSFFWKALECELCQEPFENRMRYRMFQIMKFDLPNNENEYMILESIKSAPAKVIHVFDLRECDGKNAATDEVFEYHNEFRVGRSVDTDMKIADISVSRVHSFVRNVGDRLIVQDNGSKFGTLIKINRPTELLSLERLMSGSNPKDKQGCASIFQIGRTMFYFKFYDVQSQLVANETQTSAIKSEYDFNANSDNFASVPWKGTTFWRKTMLLKNLHMVPREFVNTEFILEKENLSRMHHLDSLGLSDGDSDEEHPSDSSRSVSTNNKRNMATYKSNNNTVRNSEQNFRQPSRIYIQDQSFQNQPNFPDAVQRSGNPLLNSSQVEANRNQDLKQNRDRASSAQKSPPRIQNRIDYADRELHNDGSYINLNQHAYLGQERDLPIGDSRHGALVRNAATQQQTKQTDESSQRQKVVNILLRKEDESRNNNPIDNLQRQGSNDENIASFTSHNAEQSNSKNDSLPRDSRQAQEIKNIEIKQRIIQLNDDSGSEDLNNRERGLEISDDKIVPGEETGEIIGGGEMIMGNDGMGQNQDGGKMAADDAYGLANDQSNSNKIQGHHSGQQEHVQMTFGHGSNSREAGNSDYPNMILSPQKSQEGLGIEATLKGRQGSSRADIEESKVLDVEEDQYMRQVSNISMDDNIGAMRSSQTSIYNASNRNIENLNQYQSDADNLNESVQAQQRQQVQQQESAHLQTGGDDEVSANRPADAVNGGANDYRSEPQF